MFPPNLLKRGVFFALLSLPISPFNARADAPNATQKPNVAPKVPAATAAETAAAMAAIDAKNLTRGDLEDVAYAFKQEVYRAHVARGVARGRARIFDLPPSQLALITGTQIPMRADAAAQLGALLSAARLDLKRDLERDLKLEAGSETDLVRQRRARQVKELGVGNAYRSASRQFGIWNRNFAGYYAETREKRAALVGGEHGLAATELLRDYIGIRVAAPGFSNHQNGIAVDFALLLQPDPAPGDQKAAPGDRKVAPQELGASMAQNDPWHDSWFWGWLKTRGGEFGFVEYEPEAWHWEYIPEIAARQMAARQAAALQATQKAKK